VYVLFVYSCIFPAPISQQVPTVEQFVPEKRAIAKTVMELRGHWPCKKEIAGHGACIDARGEHIQLTIPRLEDWARCVVGVGLSGLSLLTFFCRTMASRR
jgi:hypothetical protein